MGFTKLRAINKLQIAMSAQAFSIYVYIHFISISVTWPGGATVARLTPDQKVACSNHVRVTF